LMVSRDQMHWWDSTETLSKVATFVAALVIVLSIAGLVVKTRGDYLKGVKDRAAKQARDAEAAVWERQIEEAKVRAAEAEKKVQPRRIEPDVRKALVADLTAGPRGKVVVLCDWTDSESKNYVRSLRSVLVDAGFTIVDIWPEVLALNWHDEEATRPHAIIYVRDLQTPPPFAVSIQKCLLAHGVSNVARPARGDILKGRIREGEDSKGPWTLDSETAVVWVVGRF
jgi:hypothetical protein